MTVDYFLIDAPHTVPLEFAAWEAARQHHQQLFLRTLEAEPDSDQERALELSAIAARDEADRLEKAARDAWTRQR